MEISISVPQPKPRSVAKGDRWIGLATLTGNPRCGWVVVVRPDGSWYINGDCWEKHQHGEAIESAIGQLKAQPHARLFSV